MKTGLLTLKRKRETNLLHDSESFDLKLTKVAFALIVLKLFVVVLVWYSLDFLFCFGVYKVSERKACVAWGSRLWVSKS